jgi:hypothetical protein
VLHCTLRVESERTLTDCDVDVLFEGTERARVGSFEEERTAARLGVQLLSGQPMAAGTTELRFRIPLDARLPLSHRGPAGEVEYILVARIRLGTKVVAESRRSVSLEPAAGAGPEPAVLLLRGAGGEVELGLGSTRVPAGARLPIRLAVLGTAASAHMAVSLVCWQRTWTREGTRDHELARYDAEAPALDPHGQASFSLMIPSSACASFGRERPDGMGLVGIAWTLELRLGPLGGSHHFATPIEVSAETRLALPEAPPVGASRRAALWSELASELGLAEQRGSYERASRGCVLIATPSARDRPTRASLEVPSLHLGLKLSAGPPARPDTLRDRVRAHDPSQAMPLFEALGITRLREWSVADLSDTRIVFEAARHLEWREALGPALEELFAVADTFDWQRRHLPAPTPFRQELASWRELADALNGDLEMARMRIEARADSRRIRIWPELDERRSVRGLRIRLDSGEDAPPTRGLWRDGDSRDAFQVEGEAGEGLSGLAKGAIEVAWSERAIEVCLRDSLAATSGILPASVLERLTRMESLLVRLAVRGPYR